MSSFRERTRFAVLLAAGAILTVAGLSIWVSGLNPMLLGQPNTAVAATTELSGSNAASVLQVAQTGTGSAVRGTTGAGPGVAGTSRAPTVPGSSGSREAPTASECGCQFRVDGGQRFRIASEWWGEQRRGGDEQWRHRCRRGVLR